MADPITTIPGQVPVRINHTYAITITDLTVKKDTAQATKSGAFGNFAMAKGVPQYSFTFKMPPRVIGYEVPLSVLEEGFTLSYDLGLQTYTLFGCGVSSESLTVSQQSGGTDTDFNGNALRRDPA